MITFGSLGRWGRFGNQLFQIASTIGIAERCKNIFGFPTWESQKYFEHELPRYSGGIPLAVIEGSTRYQEFNLHPYFDYDLFGYYQSYKYFDFCLDKIKYYFTPKEKLNTTDKVAVHVRRTDYLSLSHIHLNLSLDYYEKAMQFFPNKDFVIFSDDISWCKKYFGDNYSYVYSEDPVKDWIYMESFSGFIIANSSYSWWAAYLSGKPTVAPDTWTYTEPKEAIEDRLPKTWEKISVT